MHTPDVSAVRGADPRCPTEDYREYTHRIRSPAMWGVESPWRFLSGAPGAVAAPRPKQVLSELNPMILTTSRLCFGRVRSDEVCASTQYRTLWHDTTTDCVRFTALTGSPDTDVGCMWACFGSDYWSSCLEALVEAWGFLITYDSVCRQPSGSEVHSLANQLRLLTPAT